VSGFAFGIRDLGIVSVQPTGFACSVPFLPLHPLLWPSPSSVQVHRSAPRLADPSGFVTLPAKVWRSTTFITAIPFNNALQKLASDFFEPPEHDFKYIVNFKKFPDVYHTILHSKT
jgi:hypothetical protein